jgi:hypothetical protein
MAGKAVDVDGAEGQTVGLLDGLRGGVGKSPFDQRGWALPWEDGVKRRGPQFEEEFH